MIPYAIPMITSSLFKRVEKLLRFPSDYDFDDLLEVLEAFGFELVNRKGSHNIFVLKNPLPDVDYGSDQITIPTVKGRRVKRGYLKRVAKTLNLEVWYEKQKLSKKG